MTPPYLSDEDSRPQRDSHFRLRDPHNPAATYQSGHCATRPNCLQSLSFSSIDARRQDIVQVHPNTGDWVIGTPEFREWRNCTTLSRHNGVLWIKGHPGTGKSTLMKHIWRHCQRELKDRTIAGYFFHARGESLEKTPLGMLRSLMQVHQRQPLVLLVDALDEYVVKFLEQLSLTSVRHMVNVSICLSSRHYPHITMTRYRELVVETTNGHVADISTYVHDNLTGSDPDIEKGASGIFMWVVLVVTMLNKAYDEGKIEAMERKLLEDLDQLFLTILSKDNPDKQETILMLQWVLCAVRPLTAEELYHATLAGTDSGPWDLRIIHSSKGLIEARKDTGIFQTGRGIVQFIHESVKDFLIRNHRLQSIDPTLESNPIGQCHDRLKTCCISYILRMDAAVVELHSSHYPFLEYASMYFLDHAEKAEAANVSQADFAWVAERETESGPLLSKNGSLLYRFAAHRYDNLARALLRSDTEMNARRGRRGYVLQPAAAKGSTKTVKLLLDHVLLQHGADVNAQGGLYGTALQAAAIYRQEEIVELLLKYGADVNAQGGIYGTALQAAATATKSLVALLLAHGAKVNIKCGKYGTALQAAMVEGNKEIAIILLEHGADVNAQGGKYGTALQAAASAPSLWTMADPRDATKLLLDYGADVNAQGGQYGGALQAAISTGRKDIENLLRKYGATM
ncbi:LOW QUALITY PROTEIN: ankyrin repeat-containing domain protein [Neurospora tetraspora]|uniref:Ankyrin repeat-containing domain protein n=1 Tax=Neurospora tetraspora TaxID=94610 RepID=A0AAE0JLE3_9PEZI|nr:LOW QUALITY PROTEIN: ankyrin repeat-containing domain protein [Neurospora tetraspora]